MWFYVATQLLIAQLEAGETRKPVTIEALNFELGELSLKRNEANQAVNAGIIIFGAGIVCSGIGIPLVLSGMSVNIMGGSSGYRTSPGTTIGGLLLATGLMAIPIGLGSVTVGLVQGAQTTKKIKAIEDKMRAIEGGTVAWSTSF